MSSLVGSIVNLGSKFNPESNDGYSPNPVQAEFIRLCAERNHYIGFADTRHQHPEIQAFVLNEKTLGILSEAGKKKLFIERPPKMNKYFEAVRSGEEPSDSLKKYGESRVLPDMTSYKQQKRMLPVFENAARSNPDVQIVGIDRRATFLGGFVSGFMRVPAAAIHTFKAIGLLLKQEQDEGEKPSIFKSYWVIIIPLML